MAFTGEIETCSNVAAWGEHSSGVPEIIAKSLTLPDNPLPTLPQTPSSHLKNFSSPFHPRIPSILGSPSCPSLDSPKGSLTCPSLHPAPLPALPHRGCSLLTDSSSWVLCRSSSIFRNSGRQKPTAISSFSSRLIPYS